VFNWLLSFIPWWVYALGVAILLAATIPIWMPIARGIWFILPGWARVALGGVALAFGTYFMGANKALRAERERQRQRDARALETRRKSDQDFDTATDAQKEKEREKWYRD